MSFERLTMRKAQAAMEYLTTYGWMLMVVLIVLGVLLYFGIFSRPAITSCRFPANFVCRAFKLTTDGNLTLDISQNTGHNINVRGINCTRVEPGIAPVLLKAEVFIKNGDHEPIVNGTTLKCSDASGFPVEGSIGSSYTGKILLYYVENDTVMPHLVVGDITAIYE